MTRRASPEGEAVPAPRKPAPRGAARREPHPPADPISLWRLPLGFGNGPAELENSLRERIKELNCLYGLARLSELYPDSPEDLLRNLVDLLPLSWRHSEVARARIKFKGRIYRGQGFRATRWRQTAVIREHAAPVGEVCMCYLETRPPADEGPFLKEERALLEAVAERVGLLATRVSAERELKAANRRLDVERLALREANAALRVVLSRIEEEKREIYANLRLNVEKVLLPILHALFLETPGPQRKYLELLRDNLEQIASPFVAELARDHLALTQTEIGICNLIRGGLQTKEIAELRGVSLATIHRHREHIRRKLGLTNRAVNLATYLQSRQEGSQARRRGR